MRNIDRIILGLNQKTISPKKMLIHSIPGTGNWLMCQKIDKHNWLISLGNPTKYIIYNLGIINTNILEEIWKKLTLMKINTKISTRKQAEEFKNVINKFTKKKK